MTKHEELKKQLYRLVTATKEVDEEFDYKVRLHRDQFRGLMNKKIDFRNKYEEEIEKTVDLDNKVIELERFVRYMRKMMRHKQETIDNDNKKIQDMLLSFEEVKKIERKLS